MRYRCPKHLLSRIRSFGLESELEKFTDAKDAGEPPPRYDKPCGYDKNNQIDCQLHIDLCLRHYRLTESADPLLIYQEIDDFLQIVGICRHSEIFEGRGERWCHEWQNTICWDGHKDKLEALNQRYGAVN
jgi:hypothetical protein